MKNIQLNFPKDIKLPLVQKDDGIYVFDPVRKQDFILTPEENVRQHLLSYLIHYKSYSIGLISVEKEIKVNNLSRRPDVVVYNREAKPWLIIECKRPEEEITPKVIEQIAQYNSLLRSEYLCVTNGLEHFIFRLDYDSKSYVNLVEFPEL